MSLLQQNSSAPDDAARGESFTKGTSYLIWASIAAVLVVSAAIAVYVIMGQKPPACTGEITRVTVHFHHQESLGEDAAGAPMPKENLEQALVFTHVKLHNRGKIPLFLLQIMANATLDDGIHTSYAANAIGYERLFVAYPELGALHGHPISLDSTIPPGGTLEGDFICSFQATEQQWNARKDLDFGFSFRYQPLLKLKPGTPVLVQ